MGTPDSPRTLGRKAFRASWTAFISSKLNVKLLLLPRPDSSSNEVLKMRLPNWPSTPWCKGGEREGVPGGEFLTPISPEATNWCIPCTLPIEEPASQDCPKPLTRMSSAATEEVHPDSAPRNKLLQGCKVAKQLLPHLGRSSWEKKKRPPTWSA